MELRLKAMIGMVLWDLLPSWQQTWILWILGFTLLDLNAGSLWAQRGALSTGSHLHSLSYGF